MTTTDPGRPSVRVVDDFATKAAHLGLTTNTQIAERIGLDPSNVGRVLAGKQKPGNDFIAGCRVLGPFDEFFTRR